MGDCRVVGPYASRRSVVITFAVSFVLAGLFYGYGTTYLFADESDPTVRRALIAGLIWTVVMTPFRLYEHRRALREERAAVGPTFDTHRQELARALRTGELPDDSSLDAAVRAMVRRRVESLKTSPSSQLVTVLAAATALGVGIIAAVSASAWWWLAVAALLVVLMRNAQLRRREIEKLDRLSAALSARATPASVP